MVADVSSLLAEFDAQDSVISNSETALRRCGSRSVKMRLDPYGDFDIICEYFFDDERPGQIAEVIDDATALRKLAHNIRGFLQAAGP